VAIRKMLREGLELREGNEISEDDAKHAYGTGGE
jgi:hypothetical protein